MLSILLLQLLRWKCSIFRFHFILPLSINLSVAVVVTAVVVVAGAVVITSGAFEASAIMALVVDS